jgi:hypothetical protein
MSEELRVSRVGVVVTCQVCDYMKKPNGRSAPMGLRYCEDDNCAYYWHAPKPGSLWPNESEADFGYPVGADGTTDAPAVPAPPAVTGDVCAEPQR